LGPGLPIQSPSLPKQDRSGKKEKQTYQKRHALKDNNYPESKAQKRKNKIRPAVIWSIIIPHQRTVEIIGPTTPKKPAKSTALYPHREQSGEATASPFSNK